MSPAIATVACIFGILGLFWLDQNEKTRPSVALWIPVLWLSLVCSQVPILWLGTAPALSAKRELEGSPIDRLIYAVLIAVGVSILLSRKRVVGKLLWANGPILLFFLYCGVSLFWSDYPDVAFKRLIKSMGDITMVLIVLSDTEPLAAVERLLARLSYVLIPLSILFIEYYPKLGVGHELNGTPLYTGVTTNKNSLGAICLLFGLGALWRLIGTYQDREAASRAQRLVAPCVMLAMVLWLFWIANSTTSLLCFLMGALLLVATNSRVVIRRPVIIHFPMVSMLAVSALVLFVGASPEALQAIGKNPTLTGRTELWAYLLTMVRNPWFGTGFESFWLGPRLTQLWGRYVWHPNEAHNGYLEVFLNLGWMGVTLLVVVLATGYRKVFGAWLRKVPLGSLSLTYFFVGLVYNFTEATFFKITDPVSIFFLFAIVSASALSYRRIPLLRPIPIPESTSPSRTTSSAANAFARRSRRTEPVSFSMGTMVRRAVGRSS